MKPLIALLAALLTACSAAPPVAPVGEYRGDGFVVAAPSSPGWRVGSATADAVVFHKRFAGSSGNDAVLVSVGVLADLSAPAPAASALADSTRRLLQTRLSDLRFELIDLKVSEGTLADAPCARYDAVQVERYDADSTELRREYAHTGWFCLLPGGQHWRQAYATSVYPRIQGPPVSPAPRDEIAAFFAGIRWNPPSR